MKRTDLIKRGFRNLRRNKSRSILTILALSIGAITLVLTLGLGNALRNTVDTRLADITNLVLIVTLKSPVEDNATGVPAYNPDTKVITSFHDGPDGGGQIQLVSTDEMDQISKVAGVARVWPSYDVSLEYIRLSDSENKFVIDNVRQQSYNKTDTISGTYPADWTESDIVLSNTYADSFGLSTDEMIGKEVTIGFLDNNAELQEQTLKIVGVVESGFGGFGPSGGSTTTGTVTLSIDTLASIYDMQFKDTADYNEFPSFSVLLNSTDVETQVRSDIQAINENYSLSSISDITDTISTVLNSITLGLAGFSGIALLAAAFGIINTQLMSVFERTKEIGLLKALGMPNKKVRGLFSYEAIIIGVIGAIVGTIIAFGIQELVNNIFQQQLTDAGFINGAVNLSVKDILMVVFGLGLLSWIAGVIPARKAQKLDPIQALREE